MDKLLPNEFTEENLITSYLKAIDNKNKNEIEILYNSNKSNENNTKKDIILEIYDNKQLNFERFQYILDNCTVYFNISSHLIKKLMNDNRKELLDLIFQKYLKFFNNDFILILLNYYKNKTPIPNSILSQQVNSDDYKLSIEFDNGSFENFESSYYLFNACKIGKLRIVKYLVELGADINTENKYGETPFFYACSSGNENLVKYLVRLGADIHKKKCTLENPIIFYLYE